MKSKGGEIYRIINPRNQILLSLILILGFHFTIPSMIIEALRKLIKDYLLGHNLK
jgi:hypothetical protein